ncbi:hypothetical protein PR048_026730 [Dryococelus australis]|uniref:Uncharacterized protein n=1 Tax=Dryococelus australis TaxID=614101 RepID=A0ABQ9GM66_9NEOP|nr:hypothetical protein PR048_026730 [Dryococelus australis]
MWWPRPGHQNNLNAILEHRPSLTTVSVKHLIPGHTFVPNDAKFSGIDQALKLQQFMSLPKDYINLYVKKDHNDQTYVTVNLKKKQRIKPSISIFYDLFVLLLPQEKAIAKPKLGDLKSMLNFIPNDASDFYHSLIADEHIVDDIKGFNGAVDFEEDIIQ